MNKSIEQLKPQLDWLRHPDLYTPIHDLIHQLQMVKEGNGGINLALNEELDLRSRFKNAGHCRTKAYNFMLAFNTHSNIEDPHRAISIAKMKTWDRAANKLKEYDRNLNDLGRGRIKIQNAAHHRNIKHLLDNRESDGSIPILNVDNVYIIDGSVDDYLEKPRKSGFAGAVNFDLGINNRKGRKATFEVQAMPEDYEKAYDTSHCLYDVIRILQNRPKSKNKSTDDLYTKIENALVLANSMIFIEQGQRSLHQYINLRSDRDNLPTIHTEQLAFANEVLDHVGTAIMSLPGRDQEWREKTIKATTEAKSCLTNVYLGQAMRQTRRTKKPNSFRNKKIA